jgi:hypothetical protein
VGGDWHAQLGFGFNFGTSFPLVSRGPSLPVLRRRRPYRIRSGPKKPYRMALADTLRPLGTNL